MQAAAYYKANSVSGDARFALRANTTYPADLQASWRALVASIEASGRETAAHRTSRDEIKRCWRQFAGGFAYVAPSIAVGKAPKRAACCPNCGMAIAA
jgi:hypothetical protein